MRLKWYNQKNTEHKILLAYIHTEVSTELTWVGAAYSGDNDKATLRSGSTYDSESCVCESSDGPCYCIHTDIVSADIIACSKLDDNVQYCEKSVEADEYKG